MAKGIGFAEQFTPLSGIEIAEHSQGSPKRLDAPVYPEEAVREAF